MTVKKPTPVRLNAVLFAMAVEELVQGPTSRKELMEHTGLSPETVFSIIRALHSRRLIHIAGWERDGADRASIAAFEFGDKPDAKKPRRRTHMENKRTQQERKRRAAVVQATAGGIGAAT